VIKARDLRPELDKKIGVTLSFFCAGSPPTGATLGLLEANRIEKSALSDLRYRGLGWPGHFAPTLLGRSDPEFKLTYGESWAFLQAFRPWAVQLWPDGSGELADISCGDPWYYEPDGVNPGSSLILVRTELGRSIVRGAIEAGYVELTQADETKVEKSQAGLWQKKGSVWGRQLTLRLLGIPTTQIMGAFLRECWWAISLEEKLRSTVGTLRRILKRRLYRRGALKAEGAVPVPAATTAGSLLRKA
jgi:coenzyme F420 hydrogenase subunit beta